VLFLLAFRPDRQAPSWRIKQKLETDYPHRYPELALEPLTPDESARLLGHTLPGEGLPGGLRERILAARIDRLEAGPRETPQAAAVIGRSFLHRVLAAISDATDKLDRRLLALQRLELVREHAREPEREHAFRHALTQEAAYRSILQRRRRELHQRAGEALVALFAERAEELADRIGHHFAEAADPRAVAFLKAAGDRSQRPHALEDALARYRRAQVGLWRGDEDAGEAPGLGSAAIARRIGDREQLAFALNSLGQGYRETNRLADAERVLTESIALFRETGDRPMEADGLWARACGLLAPGYVSYERGCWGLALDRWEELVARATPAGSCSALTGPGSDLGYLEALCGEPERGIARIEAIVELASERFEDWRTWPLARLGRALLLNGDMARARGALDRGAARDRRRGNLYMSVLLALGQAELALAEGRPADALALARARRSLASERGLRPFEKDLDMLEGDALRALGDPIAAFAAHTQVLDASRAMGSVGLLWRVHGGLAQIADVSADASGARSQRAEAAAVVDRIAGSLAARGLDARFRARPEARAALGEVVSR